MKSGGLYIFDIFNLRAMTDDIVNNLAMSLKKTINHTQICKVQYSKFDRDTAQLISYDQFSIQKGSNEAKIFKGKFTLQIYSARELREMLTKCGFEILGQYEIEGSEFSEKKSESIMTVAKKR